MDDSTQGRLLVATPQLSDGVFDRSVILMAEHNDEGSIGLVINQPSQVPAASALPGWGEQAADPARLFVGGPVSSSSAIGLGLLKPEVDAVSLDHWQTIDGLLGTVDLGAEPDVLDSLDQFRLFAGYAGWSPGQLEGELASGGWFVVDAHPLDAFDPDPEGLWWQVLGRQPGPLARLRNFPLDPRDN